MGAGIFLVAGTLAPALGLGTEPQFVFSIHVTWKINWLEVSWETDCGSLVSTWLIVGNFILSGIADAGMVLALFLTIIRM